MSNDNFEDKIIALARSSPDLGRLQGMESRVWQMINKRQSVMPRNMLEGWLAAIFAPEYRFASLSLGLMVGVATALLSVSAPQTANTATALNLHVFSSHYGVTARIFSEKMEKKLDTPLPKRNRLFRRHNGDSICCYLFLLECSQAIEPRPDRHTYLAS